MFLIFSDLGHTKTYSGHKHLSISLYTILIFSFSIRLKNNKNNNHISKGNDKICIIFLLGFLWGQKKTLKNS